jgi:hypothetical protein
MTDSPRMPPWYRVQFNLGTLLWLMLVVGMAVAWWKDRQRFEARLQKLEQLYYPTTQTLWGAAEALGAPDDPTGMAGKSWCPLASQAADWIEVGYDRSLPAATIDIYETYSLGCVTEVLVIDGYGDEVSVWQGPDPTTSANTRAGLLQIQVPKQVKSIQRVRIQVDSHGKNPWPCVDAVGLTNASGKTAWATSSQCSTVYGNGSLTAATKKERWWEFW